MQEKGAREFTGGRGDGRRVCSQTSEHTQQRVSWMIPRSKVHLGPQTVTREKARHWDLRILKARSFLLLSKGGDPASLSLGAKTCP